MTYLCHIFLYQDLFFLSDRLIKCTSKFKEYSPDLFWVLLVRIKAASAARAASSLRPDLDAWTDWGRDEGPPADLVSSVSLWPSPARLNFTSSFLFWKNFLIADMIIFLLKKSLSYMNIIVRINTYFLKRHFVDKKNNHDYRLQNIYLFIKENRCNLHLLYSELSADLSKIIHSFNFIQDFQSNTHYCDSISRRCSDRNIARLSQSKTGWKTAKILERPTICFAHRTARDVEGEMHQQGNPR